jgi:prepilin-type N-terminal cleavage/methylation domain-containing protein
MRALKRGEGFSLIELLVVLGILGIMAVTVYPAVINVLRVRSLETATRDIMMELNRAKLLAVRNKTEARVLFTQQADESWMYVIEEQAADGSWAKPGPAVAKVISTDFQVTINLPDQSVEFSPLGLVPNFASGQNVISLSSEKLKSMGQPDLRTLIIYGGGAVQYVKSST